MAGSRLTLQELVLDIKGFDGESRLLRYDLLCIKEIGVFYFDSLTYRGWIKSVEMTFGDHKGFSGVARYSLIWAEITHKIIINYSGLGVVGGQWPSDLPPQSTLTRVLIDGTHHEIIPEDQLQLHAIAAA